MKKSRQASASRNELEELRERLAIAEETLRALQHGEVDAVVVNRPGGEPAVYSLETADRPYRNLVEAMSEGAAMLSREGMLIYANEFLAQLIGRPLDQVIGASFAEFVADRDGEAVRGMFSEAAEGRTARGEVELRQPSGERIPVILSTCGMAGDPPLVCLVATDLREQRRVESVIAAERLVGSMLDQSPEAIVITDRQGRVIRASQNLSRYTSAAWIFRHFDELFVLHPVSASGQLSPPVLLVQQLLNGERAEGVEMKLTDAGGRIHDVLVSGAGIHAQGGCVITLTDLRRYKEAEQSLRRTEEQLRQAHKMEAIGRLAGGVAHDFNNLLTAIIGNCELALQAIPSSSAGREELQEIRKSADHAATLTRQLLAFSRKQVLQPRHLDLNPSVSRMLPMLRRVLGENIRIHADLSPRPCFIESDPGQIEQVVLNLVLNARDAMPRGGSLVIRTGREEFLEARTFRHDAILPGEYVTLTVEDNGVGMTPETLERIFEPFFTTKRMDHGTGLGLPTVYGFVHQSGGAVDVRSSKGEGTTFRIFLPRSRKEAAPAGETPQGPPCQAEPGRTILLAEDEQVVRKMVTRVLEKAGYRVLAAENGPAALALAVAEPGPIDLLVTDVVMPGQSGPELAARLELERPGTPVLFMSGYSEKAIDNASFSRPGASFLQKPFPNDALLKEVARALGLRAAGTPPTA